jgi:hypothetical protein
MNILDPKLYDPPPGYITLVRASNLLDLSYAQGAAIARRMTRGVYIGLAKVVYVDPTAFNNAAKLHMANRRPCNSNYQQPEA